MPCRTPCSALRGLAARRRKWLKRTHRAGVQAGLQALLRGREEGETAGGTAWDNRDFGDGVVFRHECANERMACLVVCNELLLLLAHHRTLLLRARHDTLERVCNLLLADLLEVAARRHDRGFVHQVLQVCACEAGRAPGDLLKVHVLCQRLALAVHLQDGHTALHRKHARSRCEHTC
jgi:hypothetical protein